MTAPLQLIALSFDRDTGAEDRILAEVDRLRGRGVLRLLDLLFVARSQDGAIERLTVGDDEDFGSLLAGVVPGGPGDPAGPDGPDGPVLADDSAAFDPADAWALADSLEPGTALAFLLVEHQWAAPLFDAIAETGGTLIAEGFLTSDAGLVVGAEVAALEEASQVIAQAQADEADAVLAAAAGAEAVAESERIQSAAAADALRALINAGLVEEAAAQEAVAALTEAGLIAAAADEAAAEAEEKLRAASITMAEAQVLRYLPTTLPFSVIAGKLGISRSAAKERAERLYRRLGVHSRQEAVSHARSLGLLRR
jgi:DNA-binding NarL/FixJ family response regulator